MVKSNKEKITENRVIVENGEIKTLLTEETQQRGWMTIEETRKLLHDRVNKYKELSKQNASNI